MKLIYKKISSYFEPPLLFLWAVGVGIFLGDGKQPAADAFFAISIVLLFGWSLHKKTIQSLPRSLFFSWLALLVYNLALIPFSDSPGFSITSFMRLVMVFLVFVYGYSFSEKIDTKKLENILLGIIGVVCLVSFGLLFWPDIAKALPLMNLLYPTYGHNHIVDLLLFGIPIGMYRYAETKDKKILFYLILFFATLFFSFARGAIGLIGLFLLFLILKNKVYKKSLLLLLGFIVALLVGVSSVGKLDISIYGNYKISITKPKFTEDGRLEYWRQALVAIRERPWFGSGPGTFSLESRRLQDHPGSYSWFAHSLPLEILVETGIVGAVLFLTAGWLIFKNLLYAKENWGVLLAVLFTLLYSLFEFNLSYISIQLLVFFYLGVNSKSKEI
ncbi:O-antigen ligase family protein [Candidatus Gottesmanbacteria bacterium]|nr:O-antigen ligase family protein [Candidatus Gottesmanbacteria bacterium]